MLVWAPPGRPLSRISAVLVEVQKLCYVYRKTSGREAPGGLQDIVDMELMPGESVLGARMLDLGCPGREGGGGGGGGGGGEGGAATTTVLLILTQGRLLVHSLQV